MDTRARVLGFTITLLGFVMVGGCLTLTTTQDTSNTGGNGGNGGNTTTNTTSSSSSSGTGLSSSSGGFECTSNLQCFGGTTCKPMTCTNGKCVSGFATAGTTCEFNRVCDGSGACVQCVMDGDCKANGASCENNKCLSCSDGIQNRDETGVDCGGAFCSACPGNPCTTGSECPSGYCVDGVCCATPCMQTCKACNLAGKLGTCSTLPAGTEDPGLCDTTKACTGSSTDCLLKNGQPCTSNGDCISDNCIGSICEP